MSVADLLCTGQCLGAEHLFHMPLCAQVDILDLYPRKNPKTGKTYGSNAAAWWGYQARLPFKTGDS